MGVVVCDVEIYSISAISVRTYISTVLAFLFVTAVVDWYTALKSDCVVRSPKIIGIVSFQ